MGGLIQHSRQLIHGLLHLQQVLLLFVAQRRRMGGKAKLGFSTKNDEECTDDLSLFMGTLNNKPGRIKKIASNAIMPPKTTTTAAADDNDKYFLQNCHDSSTEVES